MLTFALKSFPVLPAYTVIFDTLIGFVAFLVVIVVVFVPAFTVVVLANVAVITEDLLFPFSTFKAPVVLLIVIALVFSLVYVISPTIPPSAVAFAVAFLLVSPKVTLLGVVESQLIVAVYFCTVIVVCTLFAL